MDREEARAHRLCECVLSGCLEEPHCCSERAWEDVPAVGRADLPATQEAVLRFFLIYFIRFSRRGLGFQTDAEDICGHVHLGAQVGPAPARPSRQLSLAVTCPCPAWRHRKQPGCGVLAWSPLPQVGPMAALAPQPSDSGPEVGGAGCGPPRTGAG